MSKEQLIKKDEHQCSICGRVSAAKSVLRGIKDKKTGVITYHCANSKKCSEQKKKGLPKDYLKMTKSRRVKKEKKLIVEKKTKKTEKVETAATV